MTASGKYTVVYGHSGKACIPIGMYRSSYCPAVGDNTCKERRDGAGQDVAVGIPSL